MPKYRKKPVEIEAFQLRVDGKTEYPEWFQKAIDKREVEVSSGITDQTRYFVATFKKDRFHQYFANHGDYIINRPAKEFEVLSAKAFEQTYELVEEKK